MMAKCENKRIKQCDMKEDSGEKHIDEESAGQAPNNSDDDLIQNEDGIPTLVAKIVIESITDVDLLKKCRFINKYWNFEVCAALRKLSFLNLNLNNEREYESELFEDFLLLENSARSLSFLNLTLNNEREYESKLFEDFLLLENSGRSLSLPSPFKNASVSICTLSKYQEILPKLFDNPNLEIKLLFIYLAEITELGHLNKLLKSKESQITEITISYSETSNNDGGRNTLADLHEMFSEIKLPHLQTLNMIGISCRRLWGGVEDCNHVDLIMRVAAGSQLSSLGLHIGTSSCFLSFLSMDLTRITKLDLEIIYRLENKHWDSLAVAQIPCLKFLRFHFTDQLMFSAQGRSFCMNVSSTLEYLKLDSVSVLGTCEYPKLKSLTIEGLELQGLRNITQEMFPQLRDIKFKTFSIQCNFLSLEITRHEGVQKLYVAIRRSYGIQNMPMDEEDFPNTRTCITALTTKFPNVRNLEIKWIDSARFWTSLDLLIVYQAYPNLNSFSMGGDVPFEILTGVYFEELIWERPEEEEYFQFPRLPSVVDFQSLESFFVEDCFGFMSDKTIQHCFARIPNLKHLKFRWHSDLSVEVVRDFLQHLHTLEITNASWYRNILVDLQTVLPGTTLKKTRWDRRCSSV